MRLLIMFLFLLNSLFLLYGLLTKTDLRINKDWERIIVIIFIILSLICLFSIFFKHKKSFNILHHIVYRLYYYVFSIIFVSPILIINSIFVLLITFVSWFVYNKECIFNIFTNYTKEKIINFDKFYMISYILILFFKLHNFNYSFINIPFLLYNIYLFIDFLYYESKYLI